jgi:hypothetical protein
MPNRRFASLLYCIHAHTRFPAHLLAGSHHGRYKERSCSHAAQRRVYTCMRQSARRTRQASALSCTLEAEHRPCAQHSPSSVCNLPETRRRAQACAGQRAATPQARNAGCLVRSRRRARAHAPGSQPCSSRWSAAPGRLSRACLRLVATRLAPPARALKLAPLLAHVRLDVRVRHTRRAKVLDRLTRLLRPAQQHAVRARRRSQREVVKRDALAARLRVACALWR